MPSRRAPVPPDWRGTLAERTRQGLSEFERGDQFDSLEEATTYAQWFADLLVEWADQRDRAYLALCGMHPSVRHAGNPAAHVAYELVGEPCPVDEGARHVG